MKPLFTSFLWCILNLWASARILVEHGQTTHTDDVLAVNLTGKRNGSPFHHILRFDVKGMPAPQRDSLDQQTLRTFGTLGIANLPGLTKSQAGRDTTAKNQVGTVTFRCKTCSGKGRLEIYGQGYTVTRVINNRPDESHSFPMAIRFVPGDYKLMYYEKHGLKHLLQTQSMFTVKIGEAGTVVVK